MLARKMRGKSVSIRILDLPTMRKLHRKHQHRRPGAEAVSVISVAKRHQSGTRRRNEFGLSFGSTEQHHSIFKIDLLPQRSHRRRIVRCPRHLRGTELPEIGALDLIEVDCRPGLPGSVMTRSIAGSANVPSAMTKRTPRARRSRGRKR